MTEEKLNIEEDTNTKESDTKESNTEGTNTIEPNTEGSNTIESNTEGSVTEEFNIDNMTEESDGQLAMGGQLLSQAELDRLKNVVETVLFSMGRSVELSELVKACGSAERKYVKQAAEQLMEEYTERGGGICIKKYNGKYQMCSSPEYYDDLIKLVSSPPKPVLTEVVLETLAIIAYKSPATKLDIEKVRGVKSDHAVNKLIEYGLIEETGRLDAPGRPALFAPTDEFYRRFGINGKKELPQASSELMTAFEKEANAEVGDIMKTDDRA